MMRSRKKWQVWLWLILGILCVPVRLHAQDVCPKTVYISVAGTDAGLCTRDNPCATFEYAFEQAQSVCRDVNVISKEQGSDVIEWRPPSTGRVFVGNVLRILPQIGPALGLVLGWLIAYALFRHNEKGGPR